MYARVAESEVKYPTPNSDISKISDSDSHYDSLENEIWLLKSVEIVVHSKTSPIQQKFQKQLYHFNRNSQFRSVMQKMIQLGIRSRTKNPTPTPSVATNPTPIPPKNLRLLTTPTPAPTPQR